MEILDSFQDYEYLKEDATKISKKMFLVCQSTEFSVIAKRNLAMRTIAVGQFGCDEIFRTTL